MSELFQLEGLINGSNEIQFHNTFRESCDAMASILPMHFPHGSILDVNYGLGVFYKRVSREVTGVDLRGPAKIICDNKQLPFEADSFDIGVCDPPYNGAMIMIDIQIATERPHARNRP